MKSGKKTTYHPISFSACFLLAAANIVVEDEKVSAALKALAALSFLVGVYHLHQEKRLTKGFRALTNRLSYLWEPSPNSNENTGSNLSLELNHNEKLSERVPKF